MIPLEFSIVRETCSVGTEGGPEGFSLGRLYSDGLAWCYTLEDEDRRLEEGGIKVYGKTAMPLGRYELTLYHSPKHGVIPLFLEVPNFEYTEIHGANFAEQLLGCVAVGTRKTEDGVANCRPAVNRIVSAMQDAIDEGRKIFCTISRVAA